MYFLCLFLWKLNCFITKCLWVAKRKSGAVPFLPFRGQMVNFPALCMRSCNCTGRSGRSSGREGGGAHSPSRSILFLNLIYGPRLIKARGHRVSLLASLWLARKQGSGTEMEIHLPTPHSTLLAGYVNIGWKRRGSCCRNTSSITGCGNIMQLGVHASLR